MSVRARRAIAPEVAASTPGTARRGRSLAHVLALALPLTLVLTAHGRAAGFLDDVEAGRAAVGAHLAAASSPEARTAAVREVIAGNAAARAGFTLGSLLAALELGLARGAHAVTADDRSMVEQQVRALLAVQARAGIGNRALCLLSGRQQPKTLERQIRLVEPGWTCEQHGRHPRNAGFDARARASGD